MAGKLSTYQRMRDFTKTKEPSGAEPPKRARSKKPRFVIQEHHATALHWDLRLEHDGVGVSWAVPKGLPMDPKAKGLAVHTEDHPLSYFSFQGEIPKGEYGGGQVTVWDKGTYDLLEWTDTKVKFRLHGERVQGEYVLIRTGGRDGRQWLIRRLDPPPDPDWEPMPDNIAPMLAVGKTSPPHGKGWAYEFKWDGVRAITYIEGGRLRIVSRNLLDITPRYPELRDLGLALGSTAVVLDGEVVAFDDAGRPSFERLQNRMHVVGESRVRRLMKEVPIAYLVFDVLFLDGHSTINLPYADRRELLESLQLNGGCWSTPPCFDDGKAIIAASKEQQLEGVIAKRLDGKYYPGRRSDCWLKIKNVRRQEVVIGGWTPGEGNRDGHIGSLLIGVYDEPGGRLLWSGNVGSGFTVKTLREIQDRLKPLVRKDSPFANTVSRIQAKNATYVEPELVCEVEFSDWTREGRIRHPSYKGLREDIPARDVVREVTL